jgi:hypothetical protein
MKFALETIRDIKRFAEELAIGLTRLSFNDNFQTFTAEVTVPISATNFEIRHGLPRIPQGYIIIKQTGAGQITASTGTPWNSSYIYVDSTGTSPIQIKIIIFQ